jgi:hypothetical protein
MNNITHLLGPYSNYWAFTGSGAMAIHGKRLGVKTRTPQNINIAVHPNHMMSTYTRLAGNKWIPNRGPSGRRNMFTKNGMKLDVLAAGELAPNLIHRRKYKGYPPVMSIESLLKRQINMNNSNKRNRNIKTLTTLKNKPGGKNNTNNFKSPVKSPKRTNNNNNASYRTP